MDRRDFLSLGAGGIGALAGVGASLPASGRDSGKEADWEIIRGQFALADDVIPMSAMLVSSPPAPVRDAIERHRRAIDAHPSTYVEENGGRLTQAARAAAGHYLEVDAATIALTDSTTMGVGLIYNGLRLRPGDEILTTDHDFYVSHEALRLAAARSGAAVRRIALYDRPMEASEDEIVTRITRAITPATKVLALTWVHSSTGVTLPLRQIADALGAVNERRADEPILFCVDAVHGFGNQDAVLADLGCDILMAGCHKWLFGPRGTGIVAARVAAWSRLTPSIPSFIDPVGWRDWFAGRDRSEPVTAATMTPGGLKPLEHQWALAEAFAWHEAVGKHRIAARTAALAAQLKDGLAGIKAVMLHTPRAEALSAGIVAFDIDGVAPRTAVQRLREQRVIASVSPYARPHVRLTPCVYNTPEQVEAALRAVRAVS